MAHADEPITKPSEDRNPLSATPPLRSAVALVPPEQGLAVIAEFFSALVQQSPSRSALPNECIPESVDPSSVSSSLTPTKTTPPIDWLVELQRALHPASLQAKSTNIPPWVAPPVQTGPPSGELA